MNSLENLLFWSENFCFIDSSNYRLKLSLHLALKWPLDLSQVENVLESPARNEALLNYYYLAISLSVIKSLNLIIFLMVAYF